MSVRNPKAFDANDVRFMDAAGNVKDEGDLLRVARGMLLAWSGFFNT